MNNSDISPFENISLQVNYIAEILYAPFRCPSGSDINIRIPEQCGGLRTSTVLERIVGVFMIAIVQTSFRWQTREYARCQKLLDSSLRRTMRKHTFTSYDFQKKFRKIKLYEHNEIDTFSKMFFC